MRTLDFIVSDGKTFAQRDSDAANRSIELLDSRSLTYRQVNVQPGRFRVSKTYVTDPARHVLLVNVRFRSLTGKRLDALRATTTPASETTAMDDSGGTSGKALLANDAGSPVSSALIASPSFSRTSNGYVGTPSDGWEDLRSDYRMDGNYGSAPNGNVVQTARTKLTGVSKRTRLTLALGFGRDTAPALTAARASLSQGFASTRRRVRGRLAPLSGRAEGRPVERLGAAHALQRLGHDARRSRGQDVSRRLRGLAHDAVDLGRSDEDREPLWAPITSSGRATCTRSPPR